MTRRTFTLNSISTIIDGIEKVLLESINIAYQNNNKEILDETIATVNHILSSSKRALDLEMFEKSLSIIRRLYFISLSNGRYSDLLKQTSYQNIRQISSSTLLTIKTKIGDSNNEVLLAFFKSSLIAFNRLLHDILIQKDYLLYKEAAHEFYSYFINNHHDSFFSRQERNEVVSENSIAHDIEYYISSIATLQYSWILYLYKKEKLTKEECLLFLGENKFLFKYEKVLDTLLFIEGRSNFDFGVENWEEDILERRRLMAYSPLQAKKWTSLGMMIYLLRDPKFIKDEIDPSQIRSSQNFFEFYFKEFQDSLSEIKKEKEIWSSIVFNNSVSFNNTLLEVTTDNQEEVFLARIDQLSNALDRASLQLMKIEAISNIQSLVSEPLSDLRIKEYRNAVGFQWYSNTFLHYLFDKYENLEVISDTETIVPIGIFSFQPDLKRMFVDKRHQYVHGSADIGFQIASYEEGDFLDSIKKEDVVIRDFIYIKDCLDTLIETITTNGFTSTVIIFSSQWLYSTNDVEMEADFIPNWKVKDKAEHAGANYSLYKGIPVYVSQNDEFDNFVVVADFEKAFNMKQIRNDLWYRKQLQVDVTAIDGKEAKRIFDEDPEGWKLSPKRIKFTEDEALEDIKAGVILDIHIRAKFEVKEPLAYSIGRIYPVIE